MAPPREKATDAPHSPRTRGRFSPVALAPDLANLDETLGRQLKFLRVRSGLTQALVAAQIEVSPQQYQKYEKGYSKCSLTTLYRLARLYGMRAEDLLPDEPGATPDGAGFADAGLTYRPAASETGGSAGAAAKTGDDAEALAEILAILIRIPKRETRRKILDLLRDIF